MNVRRFLTLALVSVWVVAGSIASAAPATQRKDTAAKPQGLPTNQLIVKFKGESDSSDSLLAQRPEDLAALASTAGLDLAYFRPMSGGAHVLRLPDYVPVGDVELAAKKLMGLPNVEYAHPDYIMTLDDRALNSKAPPITAEKAHMLSPNDTLYSQQWHYRYTAGSAEGLNLEPAWNITTGSNAVVVAVLDTGIVSHADLNSRVVAGYDMITDPFIGNDGNGRDANGSDPGDWNTAGQCGVGSDASDSSWHGTHVAGTIGAATNNTSGVAGINWAARIQSVRVLGRCGGTTSDIADGIRWAAGLAVAGTTANATPAKVLNLSLGGGGSCSATTQSAINAAVTAGSVVVVAAGNSNANAANFTPANCTNVITVAATNRTGSRSYYSNYGSVVEISAPGGETNVSNSNGILSTLNSGTTVPASNSYAFYQGTSMAAPHIAGLVSLIAAMRPSYTSAQVLALLQSTARAFPGGSTCNTANCGSGIANANAALSALNVTFSKKMYVPLVTRAAAVTPPAGIINGSFDSTGGWTESSSQGVPIIGNTPGGVTAHSGTKVAWLGGIDSDTSSIQQQVTVPATNATVSFWYYVNGSEGLCGFDSGTVRINGTNVWTIQLCTSSNTATWQKATVNLSAYAGQSVALQFRSVTDFSDPHNLFIDDVSIP
ncbi:MAG: S8 family serine peptidase [Herpetosiphonaceae bacterium]|nr:S8 family serine peptidase [Herpetosiphonaceae bacterium]